MNFDPKLLDCLKQSEKQSIENVRQNYKEGTVLLAKTTFNPKNIHLTVEKVEIVTNFMERLEEFNWNVEEYFVVNCFEKIDYFDFSNNFIFFKN